MILSFLRFTADLSNEPKGYYTLLFTIDIKVSPVTMRIKSHNNTYGIKWVKDPNLIIRFWSKKERQKGARNPCRNIREVPYESLKLFATRWLG